MVIQIDELINKVERWAEVRKLDTADPKAQTLKVIEEFTEMVLAFNNFTAMQKLLERVDSLGELDDELANLKNDVIDGVGDTYVTLIILCRQLDINFNWPFSVSHLVSRMETVEVLNYLSTSVSKNKKRGVEFAVMSILKIANRFARYIDTEPIECLSVAYNEIKDRKGMTIDGTFVKREDLSKEQQEEVDKS